MSFYQLSEDFVRKKLPGAKGWVMFNWALEHEASMWGGGIQRSGKGYVGQEVESIIKQLKQNG